MNKSMLIISNNYEQATSMLNQLRKKSEILEIDLQHIVEQGSWSFYPDSSIGRRRSGYGELKEYVLTEKVQVIVCPSEYSDVACKLLWQCDSMVCYILFGTNNCFPIENNETRVQARLWDEIAQNSMDDDPIGQSGWINSFSGEPFSDEEMKEFVSDSFNKLLPYLSNDKTILEIGIASGFTCFRISPFCRKYYGTDISQKTLDKTRLSLKKRQIENVELYLSEALEVDSLGLEKLDIVIINSVMQYFPGYNYAIECIRKCIKLLNDKGVIFCGDILDYNSKGIFESKLSMNGKAYANKRDLWYPKVFFKELPAYIREIKSVLVTEKEGTIRNELNEFRFDVLIEIDKSYTSLKNQTKKCYAINE